MKRLDAGQPGAEIAEILLIFPGKDPAYGTRLMRVC